MKFEVHALEDGMDLATHECFPSQRADEISQTTYYAGIIP